MSASVMRKQWNVEAIDAACATLLGREAASPARSMDDAILLFVRYRMTLATDVESAAWFRAEAWGANTNHATAWASTAPLAICLCALRCAGRSTEEFAT